MHVVRIYRDEGRSGLRIDDRPGLQQLFRDAGNGGGDFDAVLVLDLSRWGRFVDPHAIVADEFARRNADIEIHYCADPFADERSAVSIIVERVKRAMAREYERELSCRKRRGTGAATRRRMGAGGAGASNPGDGRSPADRKNRP